MPPLAPAWNRQARGLDVAGGGLSCPHPFWDSRVTFPCLSAPRGREDAQQEPGSDTPGQLRCLGLFGEEREVVAET